VDVAREKHELRARMRSARAAIAPQRVAAMSAAIAAHLQASSVWASARAITGFVGVNGEPDTRELLGAALAEGKALWLPRVLGPSELGFARVQELAELVPGGFGLLEPPVRAGCVALAEIPVDLVLVPGLAFTSEGVRLGFGRGYYDRAFGSAPIGAAPVRVGICFAEFLDVVALPSDAHDMPMHHVVTEHGVIDCG
jgi:5-formyltetrahydrofolate cyclo-ligase